MARSKERKGLAEALLARQNFRARAVTLPVFEGLPTAALRTVQSIPVRLPRVAADDLYVVSKYTGFNRFKRQFKDF